MEKVNNSAVLTKTNNFLMLIKNIISIIVLVLVLGIAIYFIYEYLFAKKTLTSKYSFFEITVPGKYNFIENDEVDEEYVMAKYDTSKAVYIYANAYENDDMTDFKSYANEGYEYYLTEEADVRNVSKPQKIEIKDYEAYLITFEYTDYDNKDYYFEYYLINCKNGYYTFMIECLANEKNIYKNDFKKIVRTFKEKG